MSQDQKSFGSGGEGQAHTESAAPPPFTSAEAPLPQSPIIPDTTTRKRVPVKWIVLALLIIAVLALLYYFRGTFVAVTINGKPISRYSVVKELEKQMGAQVLDSLVVQTLIEQKTADGGIIVSADEINKEIKAIEDNLSKQGTTLDDALKAQGVTRAGLERDIRFRKLAEKLVADKVAVTEEEITKYIQENKQFLPPADSAEAMKEQVKTMLSQQKFSTAFQEWLTAAKAEADISYWKEY